MDDKIFIGLIIGLIVFIISSVVKSNKYNSLQKFYLVVSCIIFLPLGLVLLLMTYLYTNQSNISSNKHLEKPQAIKKENSVLNKLDFINSNEKDEFNLNLNFQKNKSIDISQYMTDLFQTFLV